MSFMQWWRKTNLLVIVGLAGVDTSEPRLAQLWCRIFNYVVVVVAIVLLLQWELELLHEITLRQRQIINVSVWLFFVVELVVLAALVNDRWYFLARNWLLPLIILMGIPVMIQSVEMVAILRALRPVLAIVILMPSLNIFANFFIDGQLRTTLLASGIVVIIFGLLVAGVDPNIKSAWDGIWWALATVSTVGYGDVVPTSALGRLLGAALVVMGLGIFVVITANFLAIILRREVVEAKEGSRELKVILEILDHLEARENQMCDVLDDIDARLAKLEKAMKKKSS